MSLISLGCSTKIEYVPVYVDPPCPVLYSISTEDMVGLHEVNEVAVERWYMNTKLLMSSTGCDYSSSDLWQY